MHLDKAIFTISLDFELLWGCFDSGKHRRYTDRYLVGKEAAYSMTRQVIERLLAMFRDYDVQATWAIVGHLFLDSCSTQDGVKHPDMPRPQHAWFTEDWYVHDPCSDSRHDPLWYGRDMVEKILAAEPRQDVGSHSFSHVIFNDAGCSRDVAEAELRKCVELAATLDVPMRSFVFPRNALGHVDLLPQYGFCAVRGALPFWYAQYRSRTMRRLCHVLDDVLAFAPPCGLPRKVSPGLWMIPPSMFLQSMDGPRRFIPVRSRILKGIRGIEQAIRDRTIFHLTFHPINMCIRSERMFFALDKILAHAAKRRAQGELQIMSMADIAALCERQHESVAS